MSMHLKDHSEQHVHDSCTSVEMANDLVDHLEFGSQQFDSDLRSTWTNDSVHQFIVISHLESQVLLQLYCIYDLSYFPEDFNVVKAHLYCLDGSIQGDPIDN